MTAKNRTVRFWQEIALALALKGLVLALLWSVWFSAPEDASLDDRKVASQILSRHDQKEHEHDAVTRTR